MRGARTSSIACDLEQKPLIGMDAINFLISWIRQALLLSSDHKDEDALEQCAIFSLSMYPDL